jgi:hypothetical protein
MVINIPVLCQAKKLDLSGVTIERSLIKQKSENMKEFSRPRYECWCNTEMSPKYVDWVLVTTPWRVILK